MPPKLTSALAALGTNNDPDLLEEAVRLVGGSWAELPRVRRSAETTTDVSGMPEPALRDCLTSALSDSSPTVIAAWPTDRVAAGITTESLITAIDELWHPAMDTAQRSTFPVDLCPVFGMGTLCCAVSTRRRHEDLTTEREDCP